MVEQERLSTCIQRILNGFVLLMLLITRTYSERMRGFLGLEWLVRIRDPVFPSTDTCYSSSSDLL